MKTPALALFLVVLCSAVSAEAQSADRSLQRSPQSGNELLDWCNQAVRTQETDWGSEAARAAEDPRLLLERMENIMKSMWCAGYLSAIKEVIFISQLNLAFAAKAGVKLTGPEEAQKLAVQTAFICIPDGVSPAQLARIVVKWLQEHPERLHEQKSVLTLKAFTDAFPCQAPANKPDNQ